MSGEGGGGAGWPASPLWDYAVALYGRPGVREACLALQDRRGADVNLVLFACWLGATGREPGSAALAEARRAAGDWQAEVVAPLRAARRRLKERLPELEEALRAPVAAARERLAGVELALERAELRRLERAAGPAGRGPPDAAPAAAAAARALHELVILEAGDDHAILMVLRTAFPVVPPERLAVLAREVAAGPRARL